MAAAKEKIAKCIKEKANWGDLKPEYRFDHPKFDPQVTQEKIKAASPKLHTLIQNILSLDQEDLKTHQKTFKHFIYSDVKSAYGAKLIASALAAHGFHHAYALKKTQRGMSFTLDTPKPNSFATLTSTTFFEKPIGINFRKDLLKRFNERGPNGNTYGEKIRIMVLDSGFREGIDLFDVKYVHLFEPIITKSDETQAIGRATRFCGQKGLNFDPIYGWPLHVYRYETKIPSHLHTILNIQSDTFFHLFLQYTNIDPKKVTFANILKETTLATAIDKELTSAIHDFKVPTLGGSSSSIQPYQKQQHKILNKYQDYKWPPVKVENQCQQGGAALVTFGPTQNFIRHYFTPKYPNPGMLLWHSVGTGKTCTAIATASTSFPDYTILYVTRYTLKSDMWKNMFDQVCNVFLQEYIKSGKELPEAFTKKVRLLENWFEPMSYRQFSNLLEGKNKLSETLFARNGKKDPLHKTLVIIDEAHKLFAADVEGQEKADIEVIQKAFLNSYKVSKDEGVKVLLMTATPYTSEPMDLLKLFNLIRPADDHFPETFEDFSKQYLDESGAFTPKGLTTYQNKLTGYISYLNREKDIRTFAYPVVHDIHVDLSLYEYEDLIVPYLTAKEKHKFAKEALQNNKSYVEYEVIKFKQDAHKKVEEDLAPKKKEHAECLEKQGQNLKAIKQRIQEDYSLDKKFCREMEKELAADVRYKYKVVIKNTKEDIKTKIAKEKEALATLIEAHKIALKQAPKEQKLALKEEQRLDILARKENLNKLKAELKANVQKETENLKLDQTYDVEQVRKNTEIQECYNQAEKTYQNKLAAIRVPSKEECEALQTYINTQRESRAKQIEQQATDLRIAKLEELKPDEKRVERLKKEFTEIHDKLHQVKQNDVSQLTAIEKCLNTKHPRWYYLLTGDSVAEEDEEEPEDPEAPKAPVYLISGHGHENVVNFNKRMRMPDDKVLVVFPVCARPNYMDSGCKFMDMFNDPKLSKYLRNPIKYKKQITDELKRPIRVYLPGDYVPEMETNLFLNFNKNNKPVIVKSGVYSIQKLSEIKNLTQTSHLDKHCKPLTAELNNTIDYTSKVHKEIFRNNVFKPASQFDTFKNLEYRKFKVQDILKDVGQGIYYYVGCRSTHNAPDPEDYEKVLEKSEEQQEASKRAKRILPVIENVRKLTDASSSVSTVYSSSRSTTSSKSSKSKTPKSIPKNTKEELKRLKILTQEIKQAIYNGDITKLANMRIELDNMTQTPKVLFLQLQLDHLEYIQNNMDKVKPELVVEKTNEYFLLNVYKTLSHKNTKLRFSPEKLGYIPANMNSPDKKCSSTLLLKRIKTLYKKKTPFELPKTFEPATKEQVFQDLCRQMKL